MKSDQPAAPSDAASLKVCAKRGVDDCNRCRVGFGGVCNGNADSCLEEIMSSSKLLTCRRPRSARRWALALTIAMVMPGVGGQLFVPTTVHAQTAPTGSGFTINAEDLRFIYDQILVAQDHAAGGTLLGPGPNQVHDPQLPRGLRTVDGSFNNLVPVPDQHLFGAADRLFPRLLTPNFRDAEPAPGTTGPVTSYKQNTGTVFDSEPRLVSNLIVDQTTTKPAPAGITPRG